MNTDWTPTYLLATDIGDFAYMIGLIIFGLVSLIAKKAAKGKDGQQKPGADEVFEPAELIDDEPSRPAPPPPPVPSRHRTMPASSRTSPVRPTPPPLATPVTLPPVARSPFTPRPVSPTPVTPAHPLSQLAETLRKAPAARTASRPAAKVAKKPEIGDHFNKPAPGHQNLEPILGITTQSRSELQRFIVLSEVLAPPIGLREDGNGIGHPSLWG